MTRSREHRIERSPQYPAHRLPPPIAAHSDPDPVKLRSTHADQLSVTLTIAKLHTEQFLHGPSSLAPTTHSSAVFSLSTPAPMVHSVRPDVGVPALVQLPATPRPILRSPTCSSTSRSRSDSMPQSLPPTHETTGLEVSGGQSLQVQLPKQILRLTDSCAHIA